MVIEMSRISKDEILYNDPFELKLPDGTVVKIRYPTIKDRREVLKEIQDDPVLSNLPPKEKELEIMNRLVLRMLVEPKITVEEYLNAPDFKIVNLIDMIWMQYTKKILDIMKKKRRLFANFLEQMKEEKLLPSTTS